MSGLGVSECIVNDAVASCTNDSQKFPTLSICSPITITLAIQLLQFSILNRFLLIFLALFEADAKHWAATAKRPNIRTAYDIYIYREFRFLCILHFKLKISEKCMRVA
jgi:hypothetical protein